MNISKYIFQSPYPNQVQIGRPDPSAKNDVSSQQPSAELLKDDSKTAAKAEALLQTEKKDIKPTVSSTNLLDTYA
ncbi:hypothetical protein KKA17_07205 [bacterium]|nr:hypothetical protein [bacterium]MBU1883175.1 hypothetical protein [bacterium]